MSFDSLHKSCLKDLLVETKDGEWGEGLPKNGLVEMLVIRGADFEKVHYGELTNVPTRYIPEAIAKRKTLKPKDILIETAGGTTNQPTGRTVFLKESLFENMAQPVTCASFSRFLRVNTNIAEPGYVFWYLQYLYKIGLMETYQIQHTGISRFQYTNFSEKMFIPLPSRYKQNEISEILFSLDDKIELNCKMNTTLEQIAQAIFKSWFIDFDPVKAKAEGRQPEGMDAETAALFPSEFEESELGMIPKGWACSRLDKAVEINPTRKLPKDQKATYLDMANVSTQGHRPTSWTKRNFNSGTKFMNGDTLLARITPCLENGKTAFVDFLSEGEIGWGSTEFIVLHPKSPLPKFFAYLLCREPKFRAFAIKSMAGTSGRQRVQTDLLGQYTLVIAPDGIYQEFDRIIEPIIGKISRNDEEIKLLSEIRNSLLPRLISGKLRIPDIEQSVGELL